MSVDRRIRARFEGSGEEVRLLLPARIRGERWRRTPVGWTLPVVDYLRGRVLLVTKTGPRSPEIVSDLCALADSGDPEPFALTERDVLDLLDPLEGPLEG